MIADSTQMKLYVTPLELHITKQSKVKPKQRFTQPLAWKTETLIRITTCWIYFVKTNGPDWWQPSSTQYQSNWNYPTILPQINSWVSEVKQYSVNWPKLNFQTLYPNKKITWLIICQRRGTRSLQYMCIWKSIVINKVLPPSYTLFSSPLCIDSNGN